MLRFWSSPRRKARYSNFACSGLLEALEIENVKKDQITHKQSKVHFLIRHLLDNSQKVSTNIKIIPHVNSLPFHGLCQRLSSHFPFSLPPSLSHFFLSFFFKEKSQLNSQGGKREKEFGSNVKMRWIKFSAVDPEINMR